MSSFNGPYGMKFDISAVAKATVDFMSEDKNREYRVTIGTDSALYEKSKADFITAIVVHRVGNGARYFWRRTELKNFHTLRDRIIKEVIMSLDVAKETLAAIKELDPPNFSFEIHVDIGEHGETRAMIQELTGMIRSLNYEVRTKPESYAATSVADRHV
ncbi:MAG: ribonuclease H-like YkuK family protein [Candidatus Colwellbacteria bacterium]|nr:ribonuclease H-like YkuK family protein [Candidatus Colwellbacteria bacterium]